jgi:hypothetical protein
MYFPKVQTADMTTKQLFMIQMQRKMEKMCVVTYFRTLIFSSSFSNKKFETKVQAKANILLKELILFKFL